MSLSSSRKSSSLLFSNISEITESNVTSKSFVFGMSSLNASLGGILMPFSTFSFAGVGGGNEDSINDAKDNDLEIDFSNLPFLDGDS